ncbi:MAG: FAD:protein FMN transferase [Betaproteobacteria bacterium]|nr:FAD:protein FMN transferase [Betaproteobacteria bacterium]
MTLAVYSFAFRAMASRCEVRLFAPDESTAREWSDAGIAEVRRIEEKYSRYREDSVTSALNRSAGGAGLAVDEETAALLNFGARLHEQSDGAFDLTSGVLRRAWDFKSARLPQAQDIDGLLPLVGWQRIEWDGSQLRLPLPGMEIDFGGIGKEYAADRAAARLQELGARHGLVNLGGDVRIIGAQPDGSAWKVGVQDPRGDAGVVIASLPVPAGAMATSGDYERFFEHDGRRYCHLLDPRTGWPVAHWRSISVVAPLCVLAGACATIAMLKPVTQALAFLDEQGVRYLGIDASGERHTDGARAG